jgi:hypothetical protein
MQIWKTARRFAKRRANLENAVQISKAPHKFASAGRLTPTEDYERGQFMVLVKAQG